MPTPNDRTDRTVVWAVTALFLGTVLAAVVLAVFTDSDTATTLVGVVFANLANLVLVMFNLARTERVAQLAQSTADDTHELRNGLLTRKVRAAVADVVRDEVVDPAYKAGPAIRDQLDVGEV